MTSAGCGDSAIQVNARPGVGGGYRLGTGGALPPLLLDDEEAVAVAIGLRTAASGSIAMKVLGALTLRRVSRHSVQSLSGDRDARCHRGPPVIQTLFLAATRARPGP